MSDFPAVALTFGATTTAPPPRRRAAALPLAAAAALMVLGALPLQAQDDDLIETYAVSTFGVDDLTYRKISSIWRM